MSNRTCTIDECNAKHYAKGFCPKHYDADRYRQNAEAKKAQSATWRAENPGYVAEYNRAYYQNNSDALKASANAWRKANPERKKANDLAWAERNRLRKNAKDLRRWHSDPERSKARHAAWYKKNRNKALEAWHRRKARMIANGYEVVDFGKLVSDHGMVCHICSAPILTRSDLHFDHVIPLAKGGPHTADNIRPAHALCNWSKGARILTN